MTSFFLYFDGERCKAECRKLSSHLQLTTA